MKKKAKLTMKERVLMQIIRDLYSTMLLGMKSLNSSWTDFNGHEYVHFDIGLQFENIKPGDLVLCQSSGVHPWTIAFVDKVTDPNWHGLVLKEIGTDRLCNMSNEGYSVIRGIRPDQLWGDAQLEFSTKVRKTISKYGNWSNRYGGIEFNGEEAKISIREVFGGMHKDAKSIPYSVCMKWRRKSTYNEILEVLKAAGFPERKFDCTPKEAHDS